MPINCAPLEFKGENSSAKQTLASAQQQPSAPPSKFGYDFLQKGGGGEGGYKEFFEESFLIFREEEFPYILWDFKIKLEFQIGNRTIESRFVIYFF